MATPCGPELLVHLARAAYSAGWLISCEDAANAFNSLDRNALLRASNDLWPEANTIMANFYGRPSCITYSYTTADKERCIRIIRGKEGTRQGCKHGSLGFDVAQHNHILHGLGEKYGFIVRSATDDTHPLIPPPTDPSDPAQWEALYDKIAEFWQEYDRRANRLAFKFKGFINSSSKNSPGFISRSTNPGARSILSNL